MLEIIFKAREEKLASLTSEDKIFFKEHNIDRGARRDSLEAELEKMQKDFRKILKKTFRKKQISKFETNEITGIIKLLNIMFNL